MAYTSNPQMPRVRAEAVKLWKSGWSTRKVARHMGFTQSAVVKWIARAPQDRKRLIITRSSRPQHHPSELDGRIVDRIISLRKQTLRDAFFIHHLLEKEGIPVSLSSVKRTLKRNGLSKFSIYKKWHTYPPRPLPERPGSLVEIDTVHVGIPAERLSLYTLLDVHSRWAHAWPVLRISNWKSLKFVLAAQEISPFDFKTIQSDHGSEFSKWFTKQLVAKGLSHRHSRIRTPNDNAHLERFNRTIQDECLKRIPYKLSTWRKEVPEYLRYYNTERPHMGLQMKTPQEIIKAIPSY